MSTTRGTRRAEAPPSDGGPTGGVYLLLIRLPRRTPVVLGPRSVVLPRGWYAYAGSAASGLEGRVGRHLRTTEVRHWHVDQLLAAGTIVDIQMLPGAFRAEECRLAGLVARWDGAERVPGFGATDCRCPSHLVGFRSRPGGSIRAGAVRDGAERLMAALGERYTDSTAEFHDPFETLVRCLISLRTQEPVTRGAAARVLSRYPSAEHLAGAATMELAALLYPAGMYRRKAGQLVAVSEALLERHGGRVPGDPDTLATLPGVGRKTANLVCSFALGMDAVCVDTHVHRIANRWGLVRTASPDATEQELRRVLPRHHWRALNPYLVQHGRQVCRPLLPRCDTCCLRGDCRFGELVEEARVLRRIPAAPMHPALGRELRAQTPVRPFTPNARGAPSATGRRGPGMRPGARA
ncbi:MAG: DUF123 domain-containing protein [Lentisphaeria bacterium]|nr:DUF123 domain-containing protein [Lentisphaeria bacterium]